MNIALKLMTYGLACFGIVGLALFMYACLCYLRFKWQEHRGYD